MQPGGGFDINELRREAQRRWLKPSEVLFILQNYDDHQLTQEPPQYPTSGSLFLFNRRVLRFYRKDGHSWHKKKDGKTVGEAHERLKVGNIDTLNCYYAHGDQDRNFQRRIFWMLDPARDHIVLVHYRQVTEGRPFVGSNSLTDSNSTFSRRNPFCNAQNPGSFGHCKLPDSYQSSVSPGYMDEVSSKLLVGNTDKDLFGVNTSGDIACSSEPGVTLELQMLDKKPTLDDEDGYFAEKLPCSQNENLQEPAVLSHTGESSQYEELGLLFDINTSICEELNSMPLLPNSDQVSYREFKFGGCQAKDTTSHDGLPGSLEWSEVSAIQAEQPEYGGNDADNETNNHQTYESNFSEQLSAAEEFLLGPENSTEELFQEMEKSVIAMYSTGASTIDANSHVEMLTRTNNIGWMDTRHVPFDNHECSDFYEELFDRDGRLENHLGSDSSLTVSQIQRFSIREISPEWAYSTEHTKVIVTGDFLCDSSVCTWACMFGEIEVSAEIVQPGVLRCNAPPHDAGKVIFCVTAGNRESCSEVRGFEYRAVPESSSFDNKLQANATTKSPEELHLLLRFAEMLLLDYDHVSVEKEHISKSESEPPRNSKLDANSWRQIIEAFAAGSETPSHTEIMDWLVQELLKDKLQYWLSCKCREGEVTICSLSKKEQGVIHMIAGLGYEWALNPVLDSGVGINFRDGNGWTALHWAACFGREKMVAALMAGGASAVAVTDATPQDPVGKNPASIAAANGHKGLAGYLSEVALTSHLSSLTLEESEISKGSAAVEAEWAVESVAKRTEKLPVGETEDEQSLKDSLAAVRNAAQAAARIQAAFRAHSFKKRLRALMSWDEHGWTLEDIHGLSAATKFQWAFHRLHNKKLHKAALSIQKKYRGWKNRREFLTLRKNVVKIQAHVRGHQVRKRYKEVLWTVSILEKAILRWRRKGVGLRGFRAEIDSIDETEEDDILKIFRKQKVDAVIDEAVSRVLSMVESSEARHQYHRILERYRQAKAQMVNLTTGTTSSSHVNEDNMDYDEDDTYHFA